MVGLYFSAHWCPPCRGFTPLLSEFYEALAEQDETAMEIVFVSSDGDTHSFNEYFGSMPWTAVPFDSKSIIEDLGQKFGVRGIPTFIVLNASTGSIVDADGRSTVAGARGDTNKAMKKWHH